MKMEKSFKQLKTIFKTQGKESSKQNRFCHNKTSSKLVQFRVRESVSSIRKSIKENSIMYRTIDTNQMSQKMQLKKSFVIKFDQPPRPSIKDEESILQNFVKMNSSTHSFNKHKKQSQKPKILIRLLNCAIISKSTVVRQLKCFMSNLTAHDSYLIPQNLTKRIKKRLRQMTQGQQWQFRYHQLAVFASKIQDRMFQSSQLLESYNNLLSKNKYPPSVQLMIIYMGIHLAAICNCYVRAQELAQKMLDLILKLRLDQYVPIYLLLMIRLKVSRGDWQSCIELLSQALAASWALKLQDLQIWAHFSLNHSSQCQFFQQRAEMSILQPQNSIFRQMKTQEYLTEIETIRTHNYYFNLSKTISYHQLAIHPERSKSEVQLKVQVFAKSIEKQCKIRHVKNLIGRLGQDFQGVRGSMAGNPQLLTHFSAIKNLNLYFRGRQGLGKQKDLYTIQDSSRNGLILKQMTRNLLMEMKFYVNLN